MGRGSMAKRIQQEYVILEVLRLWLEQFDTHTQSAVRYILRKSAWHDDKVPVPHCFGGGL